MERWSSDGSLWISGCISSAFLSLEDPSSETLASLFSFGLPLYGSDLSWQEQGESGNRPS